MTFTPYSHDNILSVACENNIYMFKRLGKLNEV